MQVNKTRRSIIFANLFEVSKWGWPTSLTNLRGKAVIVPNITKRFSGITKKKQEDICFNIWLTCCHTCHKENKNFVAINCAWHLYIKDNTKVHCV